MRIKHVKKCGLLGFEDCFVSRKLALKDHLRARQSSDESGSFAAGVPGELSHVTDIITSRDHSLLATPFRHMYKHVPHLLSFYIS